MGPKGKTVTFEEPGGEWPLTFVGCLEHASDVAPETPVHNKYNELTEQREEDNDAQPAPKSSSSSSAWLETDKGFDSYEEQAWRELELFREELDAKEAAHEAILQANGIAAKRIRAAERRKERLYGEAIRDSSAFKEKLAQRHAEAAAKKGKGGQTIHLASRSSSTASAAHHQEPWVLQSAAAQQAIAGGHSIRRGESGPEGPGFTRLPMV